MMGLIDKIFAAIKTHGMISVFLGGIIEEIIVPIPSPLICMGAGYLLIEPNLSFEFFAIFSPHRIKKR